MGSVRHFGKEVLGCSRYLAGLHWCAVAVCTVLALVPASFARGRQRQAEASGIGRDNVEHRPCGSQHREMNDGLKAPAWWANFALCTTSAHLVVAFASRSHFHFICLSSQWFGWVGLDKLTSLLRIPQKGDCS